MEISGKISKSAFSGKEEKIKKKEGGKKISKPQVTHSRME